MHSHEICMYVYMRMYVYIRMYFFPFFLCISGLFIICVVIMAIGGLCGTFFIFFISVVESVCP
jgi:hypothetical protein